HTVATKNPKKPPAKRAVKKAASQSRLKAVPDEGSGGLFGSHSKELAALASSTAGILLVVGVWFGSLGPVGHGFDWVLGYLVGWVRIILPVALIATGGVILAGLEAPNRKRIWLSAGLTLVGLCGLGDLAGGSPVISAHQAAISSAGGVVGILTGGTLARALGSFGAAIILIALTLAGIVVGTGIPLSVLGRHAATGAAKGAKFSARWWVGAPLRRRQVAGDEAFEAPEEFEEPYAEEPQSFEPSFVEPEPEAPTLTIVPEPEVEPVKASARKSRPASTEGKTNWALPPLSLLRKSKAQRTDQKAVEAGGVDLVTALSNHGVATTLVGWTVGPTVTRYELELGAGVKVARVTSLAKDIAYAMASPDVRILAPIPGRQAIGIEVPNRERHLVVLGDILTSPEAKAATHPLEVALGRDISGRSVMVNLAEMPHVLISGSTGSGKSSCINSLITSLAMRATPEEVKMILIDPKRVELGQYNDLPHLLTPVVVDPKQAANALSWAVKEMERRYDALHTHGFRDITGYNEAVAAGSVVLDGAAADPARSETAALRAKIIAEGGTPDEDDVVLPESPELMSFIVVVVDELNDLMMVAARDVEESIVRIAQMARAVGIHLVIATQRPSVDVITGVIKANVPSRMAFSVSSLADSRVILDQPGAERLIGKGDMLMLTASSNVAVRLQAPWVSEEEVRTAVEHWKRQGGRSEVVVGIHEAQRFTASSSSGNGDDDELFIEARRMVVNSGLGSTSMLQRKLRVGFARAGRLMDLLEEAGVVGPSEGSKSREVLMSPEQLEAL
ncbi:MAG: DNA translocase FtsK 4TM domain-containing protein, partial [Actinomycetes bacterium]